MPFSIVLRGPLTAPKPYNYRASTRISQVVWSARRLREAAESMQRRDFQTRPGPFAQRNLYRAVTRRQTPRSIARLLRNTVPVIAIPDYATGADSTGQSSSLRRGAVRLHESVGVESACCDQALHVTRFGRSRSPITRKE